MGLDAEPFRGLKEVFLLSNRHVALLLGRVLEYEWTNGGMFCSPDATTYYVKKSLVELTAYRCSKIRAAMKKIDAVDRCLRRLIAQRLGPDHLLICSQALAVACSFQPLIEVFVVDTSNYEL